MTFWAFLVVALGVVYFVAGIGAASIAINVGGRRQERRARAAEDRFVAWAAEFESGTPTRP